MPATYRQAVDQIQAVFKAAWDTTGFEARYPGQSSQPPEDAAGVPPTWARFTLRHGSGGQDSFTGGAQKVYLRTGIAIVQVFAPTEQGYGPSYDLAKVVSDAFQGTQTSGGVWFRNVRIDEIGVSGLWLQLNVSIGFQYDEIA